jgi:hypothetical protein
MGGLMGVGRTLMFSVARKLLKGLVAGAHFVPKVMTVPFRLPLVPPA